jgi:hypothetical protein
MALPDAILRVGDDVVRPAWRSVTSGESRWPATAAILAAIVMQFLLPDRLGELPRWLLPAIALVMLIGLAASNPKRIVRESNSLRTAAISLIAVLSVANAISGIKLVRGLIRGTEGQEAGALLAIGGAIWLTNVIVFALWYWELDRGGPVARAHGRRQYPDFLFAQMTVPDLAPPDWEASFVDYFYLSFTNATAFSPTDTLPMTAWAKLTMFAQSAVSLSTVALVIARAVNILK